MENKASRGSNGGIAAGQRARLRKKGFSHIQIEEIMATLNNTNGNKIVPVPIKTRQLIAQRIAENGKVIVILGESGMWHVHSFEGYQNKIKNLVPYEKKAEAAA